MAELSTSAREYDKAIKYYKEALAYDDTHKAVCIGIYCIKLMTSYLHTCTLTFQYFQIQNAYILVISIRFSRAFLVYQF